ncbi:AIM24 family protein [Tautonia sp. JC769]|uniref:AIM24 family protein n=1 Tax=Tautonia sp. JC769 TaxID=3232135 RepID=UPI00345B267F
MAHLPDSRPIDDDDPSGLTDRDLSEPIRRELGPVPLTILGETASRAQLELAPGDIVWACRGAIMAYHDGSRWGRRVCGGTFKRSLDDEGASLTSFEADRPGTILLAAGDRGRIAIWDLAHGPIIAARDSILGAWGNPIEITVAYRSDAASLSDTGLVLYRISGSGQVLIHGRHDFDERELARGQSMRHISGSLAAFSGSIAYGVRKFGGRAREPFGKGLFRIHLAGPGRVLLHTRRRRVLLHPPSG